MVSVKYDPSAKLTPNDAPGMLGPRSREADGRLRTVRADAQIGTNLTIQARAQDLVAHLGPHATVGEVRELFGNRSLKQISMMTVAGRAAYLGTGPNYAPAALAAAMGAHMVSAKKPEKALTDAQIHLISGPYPEGVGIKGPGTLKGEVKINEGKVYIITGAKGSRSETSFELVGMKPRQAKSLVGQLIDVSGELDKKITWFGTISQPKIASHAASMAVGSYHELTGTVKNEHLVGPGGEAPPSGSYLQLAKPARIGGLQVSQIYLMGKEFKDGEKVDLNGRLDLGHFGGVETHEQRYIMLDGITDLKKGEPKYDGSNFRNKDGDLLPKLEYNRPLLEDAPAELFVPDARNNTVYVGSFGGMLRWENSNPFWGFHQTGGIREPDALDKAQVHFDGDKAINKDGKELAKIGEETVGSPVADGMTSTWFLDPESSTIYKFESGGIAGFLHELAAVYDVGQKAPPIALHEGDAPAA